VRQPSIGMIAGMDPLRTVRRRLAAQRLTADPLDGPAAVVGWLGAVQAQVFDESKWSLGERTRSCTDADVESAFTRGDIVRAHVLRPTWHFVAPADARWLLRLTRPRVHALNRYHRERFGLDARLLARAQRLLAGALEGGEQLTRPELAAHLAAGGIEASGPRLAYVLMHAELEEVICSGARRGKQHTYALLDRRVPRGPLDDLSRDAATDELVRRYFRSHGPATVRDFTFWSSLTAAETRAALERLEGELEVELDAHGTPWYVGLERPGQARRDRRAFLIPTYDETIVGYQGVRTVPEHSAGPGPFERVALVEGRSVGSWRRTLGPRGVTVQVAPSGALPGRATAALASAARRLGSFLGTEASLEVEENGPATIPE
jgi:Winged helix DNA-binding domain